MTFDMPSVAFSSDVAKLAPNLIIKGSINVIQKATPRINRELELKTIFL